MPHLLRGQFQEVPALVQDTAAGDAPGVREEVQDTETHGRLAGPALAHKGQGPAAAHRQRDVVNGLHGAVRRDVFGAQAIDAEDGLVQGEASSRVTGDTDRGAVPGLLDYTNCGSGRGGAGPGV